MRWSFKNRLLTQASLVALATGLPAIAVFAQDPNAQIDAAFDSLPAVSGPNFKGDVRTGDYDDEFAAFAVGAMAFPLGHAFGAQADAFFGSIGGNWLYGGAGHLFWRNPATGLFGFYGSYSDFDASEGEKLGRTAAEGELYLGPVTLSALIGTEFKDGGTSFFDNTNVNFYFTPDAKFYVGHRFENERHAAAFGGEVQLPFGNGLATFADTEVGEDGYWSAMAGVRFYFGPKKSLIQRHREDNVPVWIPVGVCTDDCSSSASPPSPPSPPPPPAPPSPPPPPPPPPTASPPPPPPTASPPPPPPTASPPPPPPAASPPPPPPASPPTTPPPPPPVPA